ncbi:hypothetical protein MJ561_24685 [Klebsiella pneumoniae]|nr:hypothetical protein MJ561_24685 [Klebsiella pneumoniae]
MARNASTSPFYPLFAALDVNAKIQKVSGRRLGPSAWRWH